MRRILFPIFLMVFSGCASLEKTRAPASVSSSKASSVSCPMVEPLAESADFSKIDTSSSVLSLLKNKGYNLVNFAGSSSTQATYLESLKEGESGIVTTTGNSMDPNYLRLVVLKRVGGQVQVMRILTSTSSKNLEDLFSQLPPCS